VLDYAASALQRPQTTSSNAHVRRPQVSLLGLGTMVEVSKTTLLNAVKTSEMELVFMMTEDIPP